MIAAVGFAGCLGEPPSADTASAPAPSMGEAATVPTSQDHAADAWSANGTTAVRITGACGADVCVGKMEWETGEFRLGRPGLVRVEVSWDAAHTLPSGELRVNLFRYGKIVAEATGKSPQVVEFENGPPSNFEVMITPVASGPVEQGGSWTAKLIEPPFRDP